MARYKATFKYRYTDKYDKRYSELYYEYRGHEYSVTVANSWTACSSDYTVGGSKSLYRQHKEAQEMIDAKIEREARGEEEKHAEYTGAVEEALDMFFDFVNGKE